MITNRYRDSTRGAINGQVVALIALVLLVIAMSGAASWAYMNYQQQKTDVDSKISLAVAAAKKDQADTDEAKFAEREKEPNREFAGPADYGLLVFKYPKTWSVYIGSDPSSSAGKFTAYLNPVEVPVVTSATTQQYALRVTIEPTAYDKLLATYKTLIQKGDLSSQPISTNGHDGTRIDGNFSKNIRGSAVIFKIRDKTVTIKTDADTFKPDFEKIIKTIDFNS